MDFVSVKLANLFYYQKMYAEYIETVIKKYSPYYQTMNPTFEELKEESLNYYYSPDFDISFIRADNGDFAGFFVTCKSPSIYCPTISSLHITEFYIEEKYRRQGLGSKVVEKILENQKGSIISLHILRDNSPALSFWNKVFATHSETFNCLPDPVTDCDLYFFTVI